MAGILQQISSSFWSTDIWLPPNITWADIAPGSRPDVRHANYKDLIWPLPLAVFIIILRHLIEKWVFLFYQFPSRTSRSRNLTWKQRPLRIPSLKTSIDFSLPSFSSDHWRQLIRVCDRTGRQLLLSSWLFSAQFCRPAITPESREYRLSCPISGRDDFIHN